MMMYSRLGGIEVADVDAISTCNAHPFGLDPKAVDQASRAPGRADS